MTGLFAWIILTALLRLILCPARYDRWNIMFPGCPSFLPSVRPSGFRGITLRAAPSKSYAFSTNYYACIAMPTWPICVHPILCWPWPPYNLFPSSSLTWMFSSILTDGYNFACSAQHNLYIFNKCMHALYYQHDIDVHLLICFDLDLHITSSRGRV